MRTLKSCLLVNSDPVDQSIFIAAMGAVAPETLCLLATNGVEALEILQEENLVPDCIFVELYMKGVDGIRFLSDAKGIASLRHVPVIVHCENPKPQRIIELKKMGAFAIYFRPYNYWGVSNILNLYLRDDLKAMMN